jgi:DNA-binding MarR family transcriptional regulator
MNYLEERDSTSKEKFVLNAWGKSFIKLPRRLVFSKLCSSGKERNLNALHLTLLCICYYSDGEVIVNGEVIICRRGEWIGTLSELASFTGMSRPTVQRLLKTLSERNLIETTRMKQGMRIYLYGYDEFTRCGKKAEKEKKPEMTPYEIMEEYERRLNMGILPGY